VTGRVCSVWDYGVRLWGFWGQVPSELNLESVLQWEFAPQPRRELRRNHGVAPQLKNTFPIFFGSAIVTFAIKKHHVLKHHSPPHEHTNTQTHTHTHTTWSSGASNLLPMSPCHSEIFRAVSTSSLLVKLESDLGVQTPSSNSESELPGTGVARFGNLGAGSFEVTLEFSLRGNSRHC
jgi:hypothetical protein